MASVICRRFLSIVIATVALSGSCHALTSGTFLITHAPAYMKFLNDAKPMLSSEIPDIVNSAFGFNIPRDLKWDGLQQSSLFERPKASVIISILGYELAPLTLAHEVQYALKADDPVLITESVAQNLERHSDAPLIVDFSVDNTVFDIRSRHPELFDKLPATFADIRSVISNDESSAIKLSNIGELDTNIDSDLLFLGELHVIEEIVKALRTNHHSITKSSPDFYHFTVSGLAKVVAAYGAQSAQASTARSLLQTVLNKVTTDLRQLYDDDLLVQVVTLPKSADALIRKSRSLMAEPTPAPKSKGPVDGLATNYQENYPVAFNIILWMMVVLSLIVLAVAYGIWHMDPGRDSIIYRMTSQRLKME